MAWDLLEALENVLDLLNLFSSGSSSSLRINYSNKSAKQKKSKYFTEKVSAVFIIIAAVLLFFVFKDPLPTKNSIQAFIVASLIGIAISGILFFLLHVMELYYFKSLFKLLLFSGSVILFFISFVLCVYFRSGLFI